MLFTHGAASAWPTRPPSCTQTNTQCHTKDSGFYLYFFISYRQSKQQERNNNEVGGRRLQKNKYFVLLLISSLPPSHIVFRHLFLFWLCPPLFTAGFPVLALCFRRGRGDRNKGKGAGQTILAQPNPPPSQLHLSPLTNKGTNPSDSLRRAEAGRPLGVRLLTCCKRTTVLAP